MLQNELSIRGRVIGMIMDGFSESSVYFQLKDECIKMIGQIDGNKKIEGWIERQSFRDSYDFDLKSLDQNFIFLSIINYQRL